MSFDAQPGIRLDTGRDGNHKFLSFQGFNSHLRSQAGITEGNPFVANQIVSISCKTIMFAYLYFQIEVTRGAA